MDDAVFRAFPTTLTTAVVGSLLTAGSATAGGLEIVAPVVDGAHDKQVVTDFLEAQNQQLTSCFASAEQLALVYMVVFFQATGAVFKAEVIRYDVGEHLSIVDCLRETALSWTGPAARGQGVTVVDFEIHFAP